MSVKEIVEQINEENKLINKLKKCKNDHAIVTASTAFALATVWSPIPFADMPMLIGIQVIMMTALCEFYKIDIKKDGLKKLAQIAIGAGGSALIGKSIVGSVFKLIPGLGQVGAGILCGSTASIITGALGEAFIKLCEKNKAGEITIEEMLGQEGKEMFKKMFRENLEKNSKKKTAEK